MQYVHIAPKDTTNEPTIEVKNAPKLKRTRDRWTTTTKEMTVCHEWANWSKEALNPNPWLWPLLVIHSRKVHLYYYYFYQHWLVWCHQRIESFHTLDDETFTCSFLQEQKDNLTTTGETRDHRSRSLYRNKARRQRRSRKKRSELTQFRCYLAFHSPPIYSTHAPQDIRQRAPFWAALTIPMNPKRHTVRIRNTFK